MCEIVTCKNFAVHVKRLASPGDFVLTSCVPRRDRNSTEQHAASKSPGRPQVVLWLRSRSSGGSDIYSARVIDLTAHTVGTPLAGTAVGGNM